MRAFVTGGTGFIGAQVTRRLVRAGVEVAVLLRSDGGRERLEGLGSAIEIITGDLMAPENWRSRLAVWRPEVCVHLAWYSVPDRYLVAPENVDHLGASLRLLQILGEVGCARLVMTGTCAEYDAEAAFRSPLVETSATGPRTLYAASKLALQLVASQRASQLGMGLTWARLFHCYGPGEDVGRMVPAAIVSLLRGVAFEASPGGQVRDYLHVEDVGSALCELALRPVSGVFNVCSGVPVTVAEVLNAVGAATGRPELIHLGLGRYRQWDPMFLSGDSSRLRDATGWSPQVALAEGLERTVAWWRSHRSRIQ